MAEDTITVPKGYKLETRGRDFNLPDGFELEVQPQIQPSFVETPDEVRDKAKKDLDLSFKHNVPLDVVSSGLFDGIARTFDDPLAEPSSGFGGIPEPFGEAEIEAVKNITTGLTWKQRATSRLVWKGLGVLGWPFQRLENLMAGPLTPLGEESARRAALTVDYILSRAKGIEPSQEAKEAVELQYFFKYIREHAIPAYKEALKTEVSAVKALNPWSKVPKQDLKNFTDFYRGYWRGWLNDEEPPEWYVQTAGIGTSFVVTPYMVGKAFQLAGKIGKATPVYKALQEYRIPEYQAAKRLTTLKTRAGVYDAEQLGKTISQDDLNNIAVQLSRKVGKSINPSAVQQRIVQIIKGGVTEQPALQAKASPIVAEFKKNAEILRDAGILSEYTYTTKLTRAQVAALHKKIDTASKQLKRLRTAPHYVGTKEISKEFPGRAKKIRELEDSISANLDKIYSNEIYGGTNYFPRMYLTKEAEKAGRRWPFWGKGRIRAPYAKAREAIPAEVRKEMGEIQTDYPVVKRLIQENIDIELSRLYRQINQTPGWMSRVEAAGYKMIPEDKAYGELAGKFVKSVIFNDMKDLHYIKNNVEAIYDTAIGSWKAAVTVWSPSLHFRNMISNSILLDLSGVDHIEQAKLIKQAIKEISNNTDDYQQAKRYLSRGSFSQSELLDDLLAGTKRAEGTGIRKTINFTAGISQKATSYPADIYGKEEFIAKFVKYLSERNKGKDIISAVEGANRWLFDYGDLSSFEKNYMRRIMPFYTFPRKAIPRVLEAVAERPHTVAKYPLAFWAMEKYSLHRLKLTEADYEQIKKILPDYMQNGSYMLMPYRDENNDLRFFDVTYVLPWGQISDFQERGVLNVVVSNPMLAAVGDIQRNKDNFTGRKIWEETDTDKEKFVKNVFHFWQSAAPLPPWFPGGIYHDKIYESFTGKPSKKWDILLDKRPLLPETLLHTIGGVRLAPIDVEKQSMFYWREKQGHLIELEKKLSDAFIQYSAGNLTDEQLQALREQYIQQMVDLIGE